MSTPQAYELPIPGFFDPGKVEGRWPVKYEDRMADAQQWAAQHGITSASQDRLRIALMPIDGQITFCLPDAALFVGGRSGRGALDDTIRTAEFIYRNMKVISAIIPTMDTHTTWQIFHPMFWVDPGGKHPAPGTMISLDDVKGGAWSVNPAAAYAVLGDAGKFGFLAQFGLHYVEQLTQGGKYPLLVWQHHGMLGDIDHALMPHLQEAVFFHSVARGVQTDYRIKGGNPLTENYSVIRPEVLVDQKGRAIAQSNTKFVETLLEFDVLIICGQAKSHCVAWAIDDLLTNIKAQDPALAKKVYLVEDLTSSVVIPGVFDFTDMADEAFARFAAEGMNVVRSTDPIATWPGISLS